MIRPTLTRAVQRGAFARPDPMQIGGFALAGVGRTTLSLGLYLLLMLVAPYWLAFTVSFLITVSVSAVVNARYVFLVGLTRRSYFRYIAVYLLNYLTSLALLALAVESFGVPKYLAPVPVVLCMFPINFLSERYVLRSTESRP